MMVEDARKRMIIILMEQKEEGMKMAMQEEEQEQQEEEEEKDYTTMCTRSLMNCSKLYKVLLRPLVSDSVKQKC